MKTEQNLTEFNNRVQNLRTVTGKSQAEIAALLDVSRTMLHYYSTGQNTPKAAVWFRLEQAERETGLRRARPGLAAELETLPTGDHPLPEEQGLATGEGTRTEVELTRHLRWLGEARARQQQVARAAQNHLNEIDGWIAEAEAELAQIRGGPAGGEFAPPRDTLLSSEGMLVSSTQAGEQRRSPARKEKRAYLRDIDTVSLPIFGALPAGFPQTREGVMAQRPVRRERVRRGRFPEGAFGLEVRGDSMNAAKPDPVLDRDIVVLLSPEQREPKHDDIVAALIDGETCLKRLKARKKGRAFLQSESTNPAHGEIHPTHDLVIQGVVVGKL